MAEGADFSSKVLGELAKLGTKLEMLCMDVKELKDFHKDTIERISKIFVKIDEIEKWKEQFEKFADKLNNTIMEIDCRLDEIEKWKAVVNTMRDAESEENRVKRFFKQEVKVSIIAALVSALVYKIMSVGWTI